MTTLIEAFAVERRDSSVTVLADAFVAIVDGALRGHMWRPRAAADTDGPDD